MILTTHSMDEADILSNRIAIMAHGELQCCGSSMYLKSKFGVGYNLTIVKRSSTFKATRVIDLIKRMIPEMTILTDIAGELCVRLPTASTPHFQELFHTFDQQKEQLGIHSYGVSVTTVEEVFLKVAQHQFMSEGPSSHANLEKEKESKAFAEHTT